MSQTKTCGVCKGTIERKGYLMEPNRWSRVLYCSKSCSGKSTAGPNNVQWKGDGARDETKRSRAANPPIGERRCACGAPGYDRHHIDGDTGNNTPENLRVTCRTCHMLEDGRLERLKALARINGERMRKPPRPCVNCRTIAKRMMSHGRCHACDMFWRRTGRERSREAIAEREAQRRAGRPSACRCGRSGVELRKGRCGACYEYRRRTGAERPLPSEATP